MDSESNHEGLVTNLDAIKGRFAPLDDTTLEYPDRNGSGRSYVLRISSNIHLGLGYYGVLSLLSSPAIRNNFSPFVFGLWFDCFTPNTILFELSGNESHIQLTVPVNLKQATNVFYREDGERNIEKGSLDIDHLTKNLLKKGGHYELANLPPQINFQATQDAFLNQIKVGSFTNPPLICP